MILRLWWKEYREQRTIWVALAAATILLLYGLTQLLAPQDVSTASDRSALTIVIAAVVLAATSGLVCGAMLFANESETGTQSFLDVLTGRRGGIWRGKLVAGLALALTQGCLLAVAVNLLGLTQFNDISGDWYWALPLVALEALAWGMCFSAMFRDVLSAAGCAAIPLALISTTGAARGWPVPMGLLVFRGLVALLAVCLSGLVYCRRDLGRVPARIPTATGTVANHYGAGWRSLFWLTARQSRRTLLVLAVLGLGFGWLQPDPELVFVWPIATLLLGVLCGVGVFAGEQVTGGNRFLGDQRLPMGRVWLAKVGWWLVAALLVMVLMRFKGVWDVTGRSLDLSRASGEQRITLLTEQENYLLSHVNPVLYVAMWLAYGFSIGQFFSLALRKSAVALVLAVLTSTTLVSFWIPSLVAGGLSFWQVMLPPLLLLGATRLAIWAWASTQLTSMRSVAVLLGSGLLAMLCIAASLCYRVVEVPEVGEPFDVQAFIKSTPPPEKNQARDELRQAFLELEALSIRIAERQTPRGGPRGPGGAPAAGGLAPAPGIMAPAPGGPPGANQLLGGAAVGGPAIVNLQDDENGPPPVASSPWEYNSEAEEVIEKGWTPKDTEFGKWLDEIFQGKWVAHVHLAGQLPCGMLADVRDLDDWQRAVQKYDSCPPMGSLIGARVVQLQARGEQEAALDCLVDLLALSRNMRGHAAIYFTEKGIGMERPALEVLDRGLVQLVKKPALLRRGLQMLQEHERERPPFTDAFKVEYVLMRNSLKYTPWWFFHSSPGLFRSRSGADSLFQAGQMPWENARRQRLLDAAYAGYLRFAEADYTTLTPQLVAHEQAAKRRKDSWEEYSVLRGWLAAQDGAGASLSRERLSRLVLSSWLGTRVAWWGGIYSLQDRAALCQLRGTELKIALTLYESEKGKPASRLEDLVPDYLRALPVDPYSGQSFHYRVSQGEEIPCYPAVNPASLKTSVGQGIVWSVGADGVDNFGMVDGGHFVDLRVIEWTEHKLDWVFLVPRASKH